MTAPPSVLLVTNYRPDRQHSMLRFSRLLIEGLKKRDVTLFETNPKEFFRRIFTHRIKKWGGYADKYLAYPPRLKQEVRRFHRKATEDGKRLIVHIVDHSNSPYLAEAKKVPSLLTCHDLIAVRCSRGDFPGVEVSASGKLLQAKIRKHLGRPTLIACDSKSTKEDWQELVPETRGREEVVHLGLQQETSSSSHSKLIDHLPFQPFQTSYLLHVGNDAWYKNRKAVVEGFLTFLDKHSDEQLQLVLVGPPVNVRLIDPRHRKRSPIR